MLPHHQQTIERAREHFEGQPGVLALLLGGSVAHGFAETDSDVDVLIVVSAGEHAQRVADDQLTFLSRELATYEGGYVDGKYITPEFMQAVELRGSDPARYAFADARVLLGETPELSARLQRIARYPIEERDARLSRFHAQLEAWNWYAGQADRRHNDYLMNLAVNKLVLFAGRLILAHNALLFPYHKWFLRVLEGAPDKPPELAALIQRVNRQPTLEGAQALYSLVNGFRDWGRADVSWPQRFLHDTELTWMRDAVSVDDE